LKGYFSTSVREQPLKIEDVETNENVSEVTVRVISKAPPRIIRTRGGRKTQLTELLVGDESGTIILTLWGFGEGSDLMTGDVLKITDGWAKEWKGKPQLSLGRSGKMEVIEDDGTVPEVSDLMGRMDQSGSEPKAESD
jgi:replication factor A1